IPQELREGCDPADPSQGAESAFRCRQATVNLFSADSALERAYQDVLRESGAVRASGDCSTGRTGEHRYPATGEPRGRVACSMIGTTSSYAWTDLKAQALVRASRKDDESGRLRDAWVGWQRILPFPTADERELIDRFGDDSCVRAPAADLETFIDPVAGIRCASGGRTVSYYRFATLDDLRRSYRGKTPCGAAPTINSFLSVRLGTTGCVTRSVTQTLMDWTVEPQLVLASTEGIDAKSLGSWWVSKQSTPTRLAWAMAPDFPTPEERKLKALIPVPKGAVCMRPSPERMRADGPTATVVGVACGPTRGAREVYYYQFRDVTAMQRNYQGGGLMNGAACDEKTKGFTGEQSYDIDKKPAGRLRCGVNAQGRFLTWTDERLNIQTFAYGGADPKTFYDWWENDSGPNEE
ncbi:MAG: hypothetical protein HOY71_17945, partial [Nonomuraea sp.]|nr:hypothetical protein [Nonomuraea sp.]